MPERGKSTARRRAGGRAPARRRESGRSVAEEITVLVNTLRELAAIRATAEDAASRILDSAEGLLAFADNEEAKKAEEAILSIMTACGFHDLVGQRVTKIAETLDRVIATRMKADKGRKRAAPKARARAGSRSKDRGCPARATRTRRGSTRCSATTRRYHFKRAHGAERTLLGVSEQLGEMRRDRASPRRPRRRYSPAHATRSPRTRHRCRGRPRRRYRY